MSADTESAVDRLQQWIVQQLQRDRALSKDPETVAQAAQHLTGNDRLLPVEQLEIYRQQFWLRHTSALLEDFPGLSGILGQSAWERLVESYLTSKTPSSWTLRDLGADLPAHVEASKDLEHHALCVDMARLEWAYIEVFDAPDAPGLDAAKLATIPEDAWQHARIVFSPALRLLRVDYPVAELRRALKGQALGERTEAVEIPAPRAQNLVVFRGIETRGLFFLEVSDGAFELLGALADGLPLVPACERAAEVVPAEADQIERHVGDWFQQWGVRGWVIDVQTA